MTMLAGLLLFVAQAAVDAPLPPVPKRVADFIARRDECEHWGGEEPYDKARRAEIDRAIRDLRCTSLRRDEARLRQLYGDRPEVIIALDQEPVL